MAAVVSGRTAAEVAGARPLEPRARLAVLGLGLAAAGLVVWALADGRFRDAEGALAGRACLPLGLGAAAALLAWARSRGLGRFGLWLAVAVAGHAAALQLIDAGRPLRYQHYKAASDLLTGGSAAITAALLLQLLLVVAALRSRWEAMRGWARCSLPAGRLAAVAVLLVLSGTVVSASPGRYLLELTLAATIQAASLGSLVLAVWSIPGAALAALGSRVAAILDRVPSRRGGPDRLALGAAVWVVVLSAALAYFSYERHPHVADEVAYLYQARYFAEGALTLPRPAAWEAFEFYLVQPDGDRWFAAVPPGWPAVLAVGVLLGAPWLVNPVLAGANVLLAHALLRDLYDRRVARVAVLLLAVSPLHVLMAMNFMTHTLSLTLALAAAVAVVRARDARPAAWGLLAGVALGAGLVVRPLDGLIVAGLVGLWAIGVGGRRLPLAALGALAIGAVVVGGASLPYNRLLTGDPRVFPIIAYTDRYFGLNSNAYGFGADRGMGWAIDPFPGHGPLDGLVNASLNTFGLDVELFGWSVGSLLPMLLLLARGRPIPGDWRMGAVLAAVFAAYFFYYFSGGPDFGPRYWFLMLPACVALTVRGLEWLAGSIDAPRPGGGARVAPTPPGAVGTGAVAAGVLCLTALALVNHFPWRAIDKYHRYLNMRADVRQIAQEPRLAGSLVLVRGDMHPDFSSAAIYNPLDLRAPAPIFAWDRNGETRAEILRAYRDRPVWVLDGPTLTGNGYRVVRGPLAAEALLAEPRQGPEHPPSRFR